MERILDLGGGTGGSGRAFGLDLEDCHITGIDIQVERARIAQLRNQRRGWQYLCACREQIPFPDGSFDGVFSEVALPYMHISRTLAELHRVLVPGGWLRVTLHSPRFSWQEFRRTSQTQAVVVSHIRPVEWCRPSFHWPRRLSGTCRGELPDRVWHADGTSPRWVRIRYISLGRPATLSGGAPGPILSPSPAHDVLGATKNCVLIFPTRRPDFRGSPAPGIRNPDYLEGFCRDFSRTTSPRRES